MTLADPPPFFKPSLTLISNIYFTIRFICFVEILIHNLAQNTQY